MTMTNIATTAAPPAPPEEPKVQIEPASMQLDLATQHRRFWFCRMPEGAVSADLVDPGIWRRVQENRDKTLMRFDHIFAVGYDETWFAEATVVEVTQTGATLAMLKVASIDRRQKPMMDDGVYRVEWRGNGFVVVRVRDGQPVSMPVQSEEVANRELSNQYPRKAS